MAKKPAKIAPPPGFTDYLREIGRKGGKKKVPKGLSQLSPEERSAIAKQGAAKRWEKKGAKKATK